jgi:hypothetical protein
VQADLPDPVNLHLVARIKTGHPCHDPAAQPNCELE